MLEVGTGSGYSAAVLARLAERVISVERVPALAAGAERALTELGVDGVEVVVGDGSVGSPVGRPFDAIAVHATAPAPPPSLLAQLATAAVSWSLSPPATSTCSPCTNAAWTG